MLLPAGVLLPGALQEVKLLSMSTLNEEGVMDVKQTACERLLTSRVEVKMQVGLALTLLPGSAAALDGCQGQEALAFVRRAAFMACMQCPGPACSLPALFKGLQWPAVTRVATGGVAGHCKSLQRVCRSTHGTPADLSSLAA